MGIISFSCGGVFRGVMVGMNRSERIQDLKHRMVAKYGSCLIAIPEDTAAFPAMKKDDTPEERAQKLRKKQLILDAREAAYKMKVPEMLSELDRIIARIKAARPDPAQGGVGVDGVHSTSAAALSITVMCDQCGNRVRACGSYCTPFLACILNQSLRIAIGLVGCGGAGSK